MHGGESAVREAALFLDRQRGPIQQEVDRRLAGKQPAAHPRAEIVRRFRSYCRLASIHPEAARPSLDGLGGTPIPALETAVSVAVEASCGLGPPPAVAEALRALEARFRAGMRRTMRSEPREERHRGRRRSPNAGRRVRAAIDRIGDAYVALCLETGTVHDMNPAAENLFGTEATRLLERSFGDLVHPDDKLTFEELEARLDAGEDAGPIDLCFARASGERVPVELTAANHTIAGKRLAILVARERADRPQPYSTRSM
jgi:PAS domain S-box-containing protein